MSHLNFPPPAPVTQAYMITPQIAHQMNSLLRVTEQRAVLAETDLGACHKEIGKLRVTIEKQNIAYKRLVQEQDSLRSKIKTLESQKTEVLSQAQKLRNENVDMKHTVQTYAKVLKDLDDKVSEVQSLCKKT